MLENTLIPYTHADTQLEGFFAYSSSEKRPLVLLCHAWNGKDSTICERAKHIASLGYAAFAMDMYGKGVLGKSKQENAALKKPFVEDRSFLQQRLLQGFHTACALPYVNSTRVVVLGFGFGGMCALDLARSGVNLKGAISVYGHFDPPRNCLIQPIQAPILILHGYNDPISPMNELHAFQREMNEAQVKWQSHVYGNTFHAFVNPEAHDLTSGILYNPSSTKHAFYEIEKFLEDVL